MNIEDNSSISSSSEEDTQILKKLKLMHFSSGESTPASSPSSPSCMVTLVYNNRSSSEGANTASFISNLSPNYFSIDFVNKKLSITLENFIDSYSKKRKRSDLENPVLGFVSQNM
jgi:hypothetical protein